MRQDQTGTWVATPEEAQALQNVADRVSSWQDGAEGPVIRDEFRRIADEVGVDVPSDLAEALCAHVEHKHERPNLDDFVTVSP